MEEAGSFKKFRRGRRESGTSVTRMFQQTFDFGADVTHMLDRACSDRRGKAQVGFIPIK